MAMTKQQKQEQTRRLAKRMFMKWSAEGGRFYKHETHYYLRTSSGTGWLVDFAKCDDIIEEIWNSGGLEHPSYQGKKLLVDELLRHIKPVAVPVKTKGFKLEDFADPLCSKSEQLENYVNACDYQNTYK
jgi:hypothetical protein